ncbi:hypothetical protein C8R45DRAFT_824598, partial [Mycena sanguinolenta]
KIWSIYVGEAERYDAALVESWKADMEGMLIFSGLFSASLTAFLIESYKDLQPDSGDQTVAGIALLSRQLAAIASDTTFVLPPSPTFTPTAGSLWCNALWFISLSLSLTCALLVTLVEQWAREFLHKTEMRPSPLRRARVFSFLYFGLKHFRMHTIVDAIPFLLHASLLLFFAGLVAFLLPVNRIIVPDVHRVGGFRGFVHRPHDPSCSSFELPLPHTVISSSLVLPPGLLRLFEKI